MSQARWLWFIAGPNGAGKSTRAAEFLGGLGEIVNPDEIAGEMSAAPEEALAAGRAAIDRRKELLKAGNSFSLETTLSGRTLIRLAQAAKDEGLESRPAIFRPAQPRASDRTRSASSEIRRP
jgi:predicted ABC-type ATPase